MKKFMEPTGARTVTLLAAAAVLALATCAIVNGESVATTAQIQDFAVVKCLGPVLPPFFGGSGGSRGRPHHHHHHHLHQHGLLHHHHHHPSKKKAACRRVVEASVVPCMEFLTNSTAPPPVPGDGCCMGMQKLDTQGKPRATCKCLVRYASSSPAAFLNTSLLAITGLCKASP